MTLSKRHDSLSHRNNLWPGVNPLEPAEIQALFAMKGRADDKAVSWLVRDITDIERWGVLSNTARKITERYLPGPVTLVVPAKPDAARHTLQPDGTLSFRISSDPVAQRVITEFMAEHDAPLTCTSANVSGQPTGDSPAAILKQFADAGRDTTNITVIDDGVRRGTGSTVVRVVGDEITVLRQGSVHIDLPQ